MTTSVPLHRRAARSALLLVAAGTAWLWTVLRWGGMGAMHGTMGLGMAGFDVMWTVMMAAMMLPATAPIASMYARSLTSRRTLRMAVFTAGYIAVWAAAGLPAYLLAVGAGRAASQRPLMGTGVAAAIFAVNGVYQLTPWKDRCLARCRAPIGVLITYASFQGRSRDLRAGAHHGAFCLGCCWSLMALLVAFGMMNLWAMAALTAVVASEKLVTVGPVIARAAGFISLGMVIAVFWVPALAPGLTGGAMTGT